MSGVPPRRKVYHHLLTLFPPSPLLGRRAFSHTGLPHPSAGEPFKLKPEEETDAAIADRMLAFGSRRVQIQWLDKPNKGDKPKEILAKAVIEAAANCKGMRAAVFVREEVAIADNIAAGLRKKGVSQSGICKITGRIRGYERERLTKQHAFTVFLSERSASTEGANAESFFLIGTAAAEIGT